MDTTSVAVNMECGWNAKGMEFVITDCCTRKWLRLGDLGISLGVIRPLVLGLKKTRLVDFPDLFEGRGEKGQQVDPGEENRGSGFSTLSFHVKQAFILHSNLPSL